METAKSFSSTVLERPLVGQDKMLGVISEMAKSENISTTQPINCLYGSSENKVVFSNGRVINTPLRDLHNVFCYITLRLVKPRYMSENARGNGSNGTLRSKRRVVDCYLLFAICSLKYCCC